MSKVPKFFKSNPEKTLALLLGVVILSLGVVFVTFAWTPPTQNPPKGNISAPLNVSGAAQVKEGRLGIMTDTECEGCTGYSTDYAVAIGDAGSGDDGLKISGPLHLDGADGNNNITGVNKITVNTVDPVYEIEGKKYATYMPDTIGQKVYFVGEEELKQGKKAINLAEQPKGSDLWLFWKTIKQDSIVPFVTPQEPADLYARMEGSKLIVESMSKKEVKFSYRLIAKRIDDKGSNIYSNQDIDTYIDRSNYKN